MLASIVDVTERHRLRNAQRASLEEQLEFERFVAELSFQFINLPNDQVADSIQARPAAHLCAVPPRTLLVLQDCR